MWLSQVSEVETLDHVGEPTLIRGVLLGGQRVRVTGGMRRGTD